MRIQRLDPVGDPADFAAVLPVFQQHVAEMEPGFPTPGPTKLRFWLSDGYDSRADCYGVFADEGDGPALALVRLSFHLEENRELANAIMALPQDQRKAELGPFVVREALRLAAAEGATRMVTETSAANDPTDFLTALGARNVYTSFRSILDLTEIDRKQYEAWAAGSEKNADYRLVRWIDHCPEELAESFCAAMDAMADAPQENLQFEHPKANLARLRGQEQRSAEFGVRRLVLAAVDAAGRVAGFNLFITFPDEPRTVEIWDTAVLEEHRGHGLGLRIKAAASLWMLEEHPQAQWVHTFNNHENTHMLAVNDAMGYRRSEEWYDFEFATGG
jgi:GNAT superfamily N-acetyltransferase